MQTNNDTKVALINNKTYANRKDRQPGWSTFTTSGQEMEWVYSFNHKAKTGPQDLDMPT